MPRFVDGLPLRPRTPRPRRISIAWWCLAAAGLVIRAARAAPAPAVVAPKATWFTAAEVRLRGGGLAPERNYRVAAGRNEFSFELKPPATGTVDLVILSFGRTAYPRFYRLNYVLKIDDVTAVDERSILGFDATVGLSEKIIPLPAALTAGKSSFEVTFQAREGGRTPSVTELRLVRR